MPTDLLGFGILNRFFPDVQKVHEATPSALRPTRTRNFGSSCECECQEPRIEKPTFDPVSFEVTWLTTSEPCSDESGSAVCVLVAYFLGLTALVRRIQSSPKQPDRQVRQHACTCANRVQSLRTTQTMTNLMANVCSFPKEIAA